MDGNLISQAIQKSISNLLSWSKSPLIVQPADQHSQTNDSRKKYAVSSNNSGKDMIASPTSLQSMPTKKLVKNSLPSSSSSQKTNRSTPNIRRTRATFSKAAEISRKGSIETSQDEFDELQRKNRKKENSGFAMANYHTTNEDDKIFSQGEESQQSSQSESKLGFSTNIFDIDTESGSDNEFNELANIDVKYDPSSSNITLSDSDSSDDDEYLQDSLISYLNSKDCSFLNNKTSSDGILKAPMNVSKDERKQRNIHVIRETEIKNRLEAQAAVTEVNNNNKTLKQHKTNLDKKRKDDRGSSSDQNVIDEVIFIDDEESELSNISCDGLKKLKQNSEDNNTVKKSSKNQKSEKFSIQKNIQYNKRLGTPKIRHTPARPRNNAYRKEKWKCPKCEIVITYGSRFLHLRKIHKTPYICTHCPKMFKDRSVQLEHIKRHKDELKGKKKFNCSRCDKSFCNEDSLTRHIETSHCKPQYSLSCAICDQVFFSSIDLGHHIRSNHSSGEDKPFGCRQCDKSYKSSGSLKWHVLSVHRVEKPYNCSQCKLGFIRKHLFERHMKMRHSKKDSTNNLPNLIQGDEKCSHIKPTLIGKSELIFCIDCGHAVCGFCSYKFKTKRQFRNHTHRNFCALCVRKYPDEKAYKLHVAYHEPENVICYRCETCQFGFTTQKYLNIHARKKHGLTLKFNELKCEICSKTFKKNNLLSIHKQIHQKVKKYPCPWCKESYITKTLLYFHLMRKHTKEKPYRCKEKGCKKGFVSKAYLNRHKKSHSDERLFQCNICQAKLKSNRNLQLHMQTHDPNKNYMCDICGLKFRQQCYLKLHKRIHLENKPFPCMYCSNSYLKKHSLKEHLVRIHEIKSDETINCPKCNKKFRTQQALSEHTRSLKCGVRMGKSKEQEVERNNYLE